MAEPVILTWNVTNWITVILMAAVGFIILGFIQKLVVKRQAASASLAEAA
jgi:hypothetical protein